jgi:hypothetical protein
VLPSCPPGLSVTVTEPLTVDPFPGLVTAASASTATPKLSTAAAVTVRASTLRTIDSYLMMPAVADEGR